MNIQEQHIATIQLINKDLELNLLSDINDMDLLDYIADWIYALVDNNPEQLFSLLYRLDVDEQKVHAAMRLDAKEPTNIAIAKLIIERQKQKIQSRILYSDENDKGDGSW
ncbi:MAG: hypothetical protein MK212_13205 [Saprospiraceae bacterium]|nr:hypothetical protein [Saprospiraceae bacterium]